MSGSADHELDRGRLDDALAYADTWLDFQLRNLRVPGIAVAVASKDDLLLSKAYGLASVDPSEPLTTRHTFRIASHSKMFTSVAILQLVEQGRLRLDDTLGALLAWSAANAALAATTIRELLAHGSGTIRDGVDAAHWQLRKPFPDVDELRAMAVAEGPVLPRNERFKYSNIGYSVLGQVIETVTGTSYADHLHASVIEPLGLTHTTPDVDPSHDRPVATGYTSRRGGRQRNAFPIAPTDAMASATGFCSTAEELCRFGAALRFGADTLLTDESKRLMQQELWAVEGEDKHHYGLGVGIWDVGGRRMIGHGGGFPGFITSTRIDPVAGLVVIVLTNAIDGPAAELANGVIRVVNRAQQAPATNAAHSRGDLDRFTGRFENIWEVRDVMRFGGELISVRPEALNPVDKVTVLDVESADTLRIREDGGYASPGESVRYAFAADGSIRSVTWAGQPLSCQTVVAP